MQPVRSYQLSRDLAELTVLLESALMGCGTVGSSRRDDVIDAFLVAAGISQILDDYRFRDFRIARKLAQRLLRRQSVIERATGRLLSVLNRSGSHARAKLVERGLAPLRKALNEVLDRLADAVVRAARLELADGKAAALLARLKSAPVGLESAVLCLPQCFFAFDQRPEDLGLLSERFSWRWPNRDRQIAVVGIRTSGSYLAPLTAAHLRRLGYRFVETLTWRDGQSFFEEEKAALRNIRENRGLVLLIDDPPTSGTTLHRAASAFEERGIPRQSLVLLLQVFDSPGWWPWRQRLAPYQWVTLPFKDWTIHDVMSVASVRSALTGFARAGEAFQSGLVGPAPVFDVKAVDSTALTQTTDGGVRRHVRARYQAQLSNPTTGWTSTHEIEARGVGLGYYGRAAFATAKRLGGHVPETYGFKDGVLFTAAPMETQRPMAAGEDSPTASAVAHYVVTRHKQLPLPTDLSQRVMDRAAMWQRCSDLLSPAFRTLAPIARLTLPGVFKWLMRTSSPSVIDGRMQRNQWILPGPSPDTYGAWAKAGFDDGAIWNGIAYCNDPTFDLAAAAVEQGATAKAGTAQSDSMRLRQIWADSGGSCSSERWLLNQLLHLQEIRSRVIDAQQVYERATRTKDASSAVDERFASDNRTRLAELVDALGPRARQMSRLLNGYLGQLLCNDVPTPTNGPISAIDIDGVLETGHLGFSATTPDGLIALRALKAHGYRVILASGRSIDEVEERCRQYGLAGGVAEYGSAIFDARSGRRRVLVSDDERSEVRRVSQRLQAIGEVYLDPDYLASVRAYRLQYGTRRSLDRVTLERILTGVEPGRLKCVQGSAQTDFISSRIDKGVGILELTRLMDGIATHSSGRPLALAVGDTLADVPMLRLADHAFAVRNAEKCMGRAAPKDSPVSRLHHCYQAGLREAVARILGHRPGACQVCHPPQPSLEASVVLDLLSAHDLSAFAACNTIRRLLRTTAPNLLFPPLLGGPRRPEPTKDQAAADAWSWPRP